MCGSVSIDGLKFDETNTNEIIVKGQMMAEHGSKLFWHCANETNINLTVADKVLDPNKFEKYPALKIMDVNDDSK